MSIIYKTYSTLFSKKIFLSLHKRLYLFAVRGMGFLNSENEFISGEDYVQRLLKIQAPKIIFDVGANKGQYASLLLKHFPDTSIYSFEPHPVSFSELDKIESAKLKKFNAALGKENTKMQLFDYDDDQGSQHASLNKEVITNIHSKNYKAIEVEVKTLDEFCLHNKIEEISFLKIDVEGFELDVLLGAKRMLENKKIGTIQFEFNSTNLVSRTRLNDFEKLLHNYELYRLLPSGLIKLSEEKLIFKEIFLFQNILAIKK
jgi:FkbM family methyltransferase